MTDGNWESAGFMKMSISMQFLGIPNFALETWSEGSLAQADQLHSFKNRRLHYKCFECGRPKFRAKVGWTLPEPEIGYLEPETFMQGTFDHGEQFRSHKDATLHYEDFE